jgi:galactose mutarotase-like enzyme
MNRDKVQIVGDGVMAEIALMGAELQTLKADGCENVLWQKDDIHWNRVAPNLFPIVGRLCNDAFTLDGVVYTMRQHGFARDQQFVVMEQDESSVLLGLKWNEQTMAVYPFAFHFQVRYRFDERVLWVDYITENLGNAEMLYSVGGHPGFALRGALEGHSLAFSQAGERVGFSADRRLIEGGYYSGKTAMVEVSTGVLALSDALFESDAIVFNDPGFDAVTLLDSQGDAMLDFYCWEWDAVGFWTKPGAPFFCIEPWWGWADEVGSTGQFTEKAGLHKLAAGAEETVSYGIGLP